VSDRLRRARKLLDQQHTLRQKLDDLALLLDEERHAYAREENLFGLSRDAFARRVELATTGRTVTQRAA